MSAASYDIYYSFSKTDCDFHKLYRIQWRNYLETEYSNSCIASDYSKKRGRKYIKIQV